MILFCEDMHPEIQIKTIKRQDCVGYLQILQSICKVLFLKHPQQMANVNICQISAVSTWMYVILFSALSTGFEISYNKLFLKIENKKYVPHGVSVGS